MEWVRDSWLVWNINVNEDFSCGKTWHKFMVTIRWPNAKKDPNQNTMNRTTWQEQQTNKQKIMWNLAIMQRMNEGHCISNGGSCTRTGFQFIFMSEAKKKTKIQEKKNKIFDAPESTSVQMCAEYTIEAYRLHYNSPLTCISVEMRWHAHRDCTKHHRDNRETLKLTNFEAIKSNEIELAVISHMRFGSRISIRRKGKVNDNDNIVTTLNEYYCFSLLLCIFCLSLSHSLTGVCVFFFLLCLRFTQREMQKAVKIKNENNEWNDEAEEKLESDLDSFFGSDSSVQQSTHKI